MKGMSTHNNRNLLELIFHKLKTTPFILLGEKIRDRKEEYRGLRYSLKQARIPMSYEMYISNALFYSGLIGLIGGIIGAIIAYVVISIVGLPERLTNMTFNPEYAWILQFRDVSVTLFIIIFLAVIFGGIVYMLYIIYPRFLSGERTGSINSNLPYAVTFMYALSRGGMNIIEIMRALSRSEDTYGEVAKEMDVILRDMDYFGSDLRTALHNICEVTPSNKFRDLMYNLLTIIDSGGDVSKYFKDKSEQYLNSAKIEQKGFLETLALIAESYVTAFVAGPLFIIILGVMMSVMGSGSDSMIYAIIYGMIPIGSMMFVVMIDIMTPGSTGKAPLLPTKSLLGDKINIPETDEKTIYQKFTKSRKSLRFKQMLSQPLKPIKQNPIYTLAITVPIALTYMTISIIQALKEYNPVDYMDDRIVLALFVMIIPLMIFHESKQHKERTIQSQIPDFLKKLASTNESGMTLGESIKLMTRSDIGMTKEIKKINNDINWGVDVNQALIRFANRVRTFTVSRSITLVTKANESSGDIGEVLTIAARDASAEQDLTRERIVNMFIYIVIIYMSFFVFVGIIYIISSTFLEEMVKASEGSGGSAGVPMSLTREKLGDYNRLFFHGALIQGFTSGLIAGVMGEGSVLSGLKHSVIMATMGYLIFTLLVF